MLSNNALAEEALNAAHSICSGDPLLVNERGVMAYNHGECVSSKVQILYVGLTSSVAMREPLPCFRNHWNLRKSPKVLKSLGQLRM